MSETLNCRHKTRSRDRNPRHRQLQSVVVMNEVDGPQNILVVLQWLTHSHKHHAEPRGRVFQHDQYLRDDLVRIQVARQTELSGEAKGASEAATNLRRNTECRAIGARDADAFDELPIAEPDKKALCPVV